MYAAVEDLKLRLSEEIFLEIYGDNTAAALEDLKEAQAEIDGALGCRYEIPVTAEACAPLLKSWCLTLAEEQAYARAAGSHYAEKVRLRTTRVRDFLTRIQNDSFRLPDAVEKSSSGVSFLSIDDPVFTRENMKNF